MTIVPTPRTEIHQPAVATMGILLIMQQQVLEYLLVAQPGHTMMFGYDLRQPMPHTRLQSVTWVQILPIPNYNYSVAPVVH